MGLRAARDESRRRLLQRQSVGDAAGLSWEGGRVSRYNVGAIGPDQREIFPAAAEFEIGVQRRAGCAAILAGSKDNQIPVGRQISGREAPFSQVTHTVRQIPA